MRPQPGDNTTEAWRARVCACGGVGSGGGGGGGRLCSGPRVTAPVLLNPSEVTAREVVVEEEEEVLVVVVEEEVVLGGLGQGGKEEKSEGGWSRSLPGVYRACTRSIMWCKC